MKVRVSKVVSLVAVLIAAGSSQFAGAVTIDFENPPYTSGPLVGQDGWVLNSYAAPNGTVEVSNVDPLAGLQSLSYTRTTPLGGFSAGDVSKADVVTFTPDGTAAVDLTAGVLLSASSLSAQGFGFGQIGFFLSNDGLNGATPLGVALNNSGSSIPSIEVFRQGGGGAGFYFLNGDQPSSAFVEGDTYEFSLGVDFDFQTFSVSSRNATAGDPFATVGPFDFAAAFPDNGDGSYSVDVLAFLRFGAGKVDNITLNVIPEPASGVLALASAGMALCYRRRRA